MNETKKLNKHYDHILVGYNLSSLTYAYRLHQKGENYCIIDSSYISLQPFKYIPSLESSVYSRVPFVPANEETPRSSSLDDVLGSFESQEGTPLTFEKGDFKSFLGFGDTKINEIDAVTPYLATQNHTYPTQPEKIWQDWSEIIEANVFLDQQVTDLTWEDGNITELTLNGKTKLKGHQFTFFSHFPFLFEKVGQESKTMASKVAKVSWWSSVSLIMHHLEEPETFELNQMYLLKGSKEQPCLGQMSRINDQLVSRWESFFPVELTRDSETTGTILKEIKKPLKRAFNNPSDKKFPEHIVIHDSVFADFSKTDLKSGKLFNFNNLQICSPLFDYGVGWYSSLLSAWELPILEKVQENSADPSIGVAAPTAP
ncbi:MAG: hypothetical protein MJK18_14050 [Bdellovibrionales bacterium]|nr:hypothetical protein [Bdellovibrionales bacterium]